MTLVEVAFAAIILMVGMLGVVTLVDQATKTADQNKARVTAVNLAREVFEGARAVAYEDLTPTDIAPALQSRPGLGGSGNPWTLTRRGVTYTVGVSVCTFDDPKDGLATGAGTPPVTAPENPCPSAAATTGAPTESNPDDFRRVTTTITYPFRSGTKTVRYTTSIINPSGGLGPRILPPLPQPTSQITTGTTVTLSPVRTTNTANDMHWTVDEFATEGDATGGPTNWTVAWPIGTVGIAPYVHDGTYTVNVQPFDTRGIPGDTKSMIVQLNRAAPLQATGLVGGRNEAHGHTVVDLEWNKNPERDIVGYRVYRTSGSATVLVCGTASAPLNAFSCTDDPAPSSGTISYQVAAVDRTDLANPASALREGPRSTALTLNAAGTAPSRPTNLAVTISGGFAHLTWTAPTSGTVKYYWIYRDGDDVEDRLSKTATAATVFDDSSWGSVQHEYRVSAVGPDFAESQLSDPVTITPTS